MPKRKRDGAEQDDARASKSRKQSVQEYFTQTLKLLHRALKTAKGFERQKLGKRLKNAKTKGSLPEINRINKEIEALKNLDLNTVGETHLKKSLGKVRAFAENEELSAVLGGELYKPTGDEEEITAYRNVVSGMCNMKQVKEVVEGAVASIYGLLGISKPTNGKLKKKPDAEEKSLGGAKTIIIQDAEDADTEESVADDQEDLEWEGFSDPNDPEVVDGADAEISSSAEEEGEEDVEYQSLEEDDINRFESLLGESSEGEEAEAEVEEEDIWAKIRASIPKNPTAQKPFSPSVSLSPEPPEINDPDAQSDEASESDSEPQLKPTKAKRPRAAPPPRAKTSTFLPTLMGGYWSGTESSASDLEDDPKSRTTVRKNRPGQAARRALWEKKYKDKANHIKSGQGSLAEQREAALDAKRGAENGRQGRGGRRRGDGRMSGGNAIRVASRARVARPEPKKDDSGPLHPSWQAAKKAKTMEKRAKFEGKKVVF